MHPPEQHGREADERDDGRDREAERDAQQLVAGRDHVQAEEHERRGAPDDRRRDAAVEREQTLRQRRRREVAADADAEQRERSRATAYSSPYTIRIASGPMRATTAVITADAPRKSSRARPSAFRTRAGSCACSFVRFGSIEAAKPWKTNTGMRTIMVAAKTRPATRSASWPPPSTTRTGPPFTRIWSAAAIAAAGAATRARGRSGSACPRRAEAAAEGGAARS
jgi:hypothetical protein